MLIDESILSLAQKLRSKQISPSDLVAECEDQIAKLNPRINAFITHVHPDTKVELTHSLSGIPFTLKDSYLTTGVTTTAGSKILQDYIPPYESTAVSKLKQTNALLLGKMNMDAWGHGASTENTDFGPTKNPWDLTRVAGGSGGGPAAAIASRMCSFALSEDTGGSIRNPAGWCNITALKVTYGRVSRYGCIAYASSLDSMGPTAKTAEDCAVILGTIAGRDPLDATSSSHPVPDYVSGLSTAITGLKIGLPKEFFASGIDPEVKQLIVAAGRDFERLGAVIIDTSLHLLDYAVAIYYILAPSETSSNLARYDGIRYGLSRDNFTFETMRRIMVGTYTLSAGYYDAYYKKAQQARNLIIQDYHKAFASCDVLLTPISPTPATKFGELVNDPIKNMMADIYTVTTNTAGIPSLALPCGFTKAGLPVGMQLQGPMFSEQLLLQIGHSYQQATAWHHEKPPLN